MVRIESVSTSGFKAVEDFEFEAKGINIVTGPNNSGKTSLLESIYTAYNPGYIDSFGENERYLVNQECEQAVVETAFSRLEEEVEGVVADGEEGERTLCLWSPDQEEALTVYRRVLDQMFESNRDHSVSPAEAIQIGQEEETVDAEIIWDAMRQSISDVTDEQMLDAGVSETITVVEVDGTEYQHAYLGDAFEIVKSAVMERAVERILGEIELERVHSGDSAEKVRTQLDYVLGTLLALRSGRSTFADDYPPEIPGVNFLEQPLTELSEIDMSEENAGVRLSGVEQFIKGQGGYPEA